MADLVFAIMDRVLEGNRTDLRRGREGRRAGISGWGSIQSALPAAVVLERISISICISGTQTAKAAAAVTVRHNPNKGPSTYDVLIRRRP